MFEVVASHCRFPSCPDNCRPKGETPADHVYAIELFGSNKHHDEMSSTLQEIGSTVAKLRSLLSEAKKDLARIQSLQDVLTSSLDVLWEDTQIVSCDQQSWKQTLTLVASGKTLSVAAQAEDVLRTANGTIRRQSWISNGTEYCAWLAGGVRRLCIHAEVLGDQQQAFERAAQLCGRSLSLGHNGR